MEIEDCDQERESMGVKASVLFRVMGRIMRSTAAGLLVGMWAVMSAAEEISPNEVSGEQIRELDGQVQDAKNDVLDISTRIFQLEEGSLYPAKTRISIFLAVVQGDGLRPDTVKISIDGTEAAQHRYTERELEALRHRGIQRFYMGNIQPGEHVLEVAINGKSTGNSDYQKSAQYRFTKGADAKLIEISLGGTDIYNQGIAFNE